MIRVLHSVSNMDRAGIETMLMNYYRHIDTDKVQFDFLVNKPKPGNYDDEIRRMGGNIYLSPGLNPVNYRKYLAFEKEIFLKNPDIKILHAHNEAMGLYALNGAKKAGIKTRIAHAHNTRIVRDYKYPLKIFCKQFLTYSATDLWSCGRDAGIYFFTKNKWNKNGMIMRNAIETQKFLFSEDLRERIRRKYNLENKTVIGHVGRFNVQKNHRRLLDIFKEYLKFDASSVLLLVGEGELENEMKEKAKNLGIFENVIFCGLCENVNELYMAMDIFVMPSLFEGLPVVGIEAQATGIPCVFSSVITDEVVLSDFSVRVPLEESNGKWAQTIFELLKRENNRENGKNIVVNAGYDIITESKRIENLYLQMAKR